jgi:predicted RNA-binding Zn-ribbon protein involved in translation (DUF1610 family)
MITEKKYIIIIVVCFACAIGITLFMIRGDSAPIPERGDIQMLCSACGYSVKVSSQEYDKMLRDKIQNRGLRTVSVFECPKCSKAALQESLKCPKCGNVFIPDWARTNDYPDRCPKCGFSEIEQERGKR